MMIFIFLKNVFSNLSMKEKTCIMFVDEVYVKPMLQYHGGSLFEKAVNDPKHLTNTVVGYDCISLR